MNEDRQRSIKDLVRRVEESDDGRDTAHRARTALRLGELAYRMRTECGLSQHELAERIGTRQSVISRLEGGNGGHMPNWSTLERVADACGFSMMVGARRQESAPGTAVQELEDFVVIDAAQDAEAQG